MEKFTKKNNERLDLQGLGLKTKVRDQADSIATIAQHWDYTNPGTYRVLANYIKELQNYIKPLEEFAKALSKWLYK